MLWSWQRRHFSSMQNVCHMYTLNMACLSARSVHLSTGGWNREIRRSAAWLLLRGPRLFSLRSRKRKKNYPFDDCLLKFATYIYYMIYLCKFLIFSQQHYVYYDMWWACQHTLFVWLSCLLMLMMYMLPLNYCDALHKCALHLGGWERYPCGHRDTPHV